VNIFWQAKKIFILRASRRLPYAVGVSARACGIQVQICPRVLMNALAVKASESCDIRDRGQND